MITSNELEVLNNIDKIKNVNTSNLNDCFNLLFDFKKVFQIKYENVMKTETESEGFGSIISTSNLKTSISFNSIITIICDGKGKANFVFESNFNGKEQKKIEYISVLENRMQEKDGKCVEQIIAVFPYWEGSLYPYVEYEKEENIGVEGIDVQVIRTRMKMDRVVKMDEEKVVRITKISKSEKDIISNTSYSVYYFNIDRKIFIYGSELNVGIINTEYDMLGSKMKIKSSTKIITEYNLIPCSKYFTEQTSA